MDLFDQIKADIEALKADIAAAKADGKLTFSELVTLFMGGVRKLVLAASQLSVPGPEKKKLVTEAAKKLYDEVIGPIDIPGIPNFLETTVVDPALRVAFLQAVDGIIEFFVTLLPAPTE